MGALEREGAEVCFYARALRLRKRGVCQPTAGVESGDSSGARGELVGDWCEAADIEGVSNGESH